MVQGRDPNTYKQKICPLMANSFLLLGFDLSVTTENMERESLQLQIYF